VILETLFGLAIEKWIICCIPEKYSHDPSELVIVCNVFDAVLEHKQENCTDVLKESIALKKVFKFSDNVWHEWIFLSVYPY